MNKKYMPGVFLGCAILILGGFSIIAHLATIQGIELACDARLSDEFEEMILSQVDESACANVGEIMDQLASCPCVKEVSCLSRPDKTAYFSIEAYRPYCLINDSQLLLENGSMCDRSFYDKQGASLPAVQVGRTISCDQLHRWLEPMPATLCAVYEVRIVSETLVLLREKKTGLGIKCLPEQLAHSSAIERVNAILRTCARDTSMVADMRFDEHVIVRTERGWDHGTCIS